ncbi:TetR/AcrR family transcriptional regulator [Flexibacterium corallicola]|uniref:TetR/AcrR family transcriptional regulator n=1 Tax=Flexibacterium corallicola TaxID=3037259 RepID=UPI00286F3C22|nr:TetR/AcrR family transcriptional regulator [Pseudovibrio sp. M1P-2-3]
MARPRKFDEGEVVQKAMRAFWQCGYEATTMKSLQAATGVDVRGLSNAFGDKEQLFLRSLENYHAMFEMGLAKIFKQPSLDAIITFFTQLANDDIPEDHPTNYGCLMVNTVIELGNTNSEVRMRVERYRQMFVDHFRNSLMASGVPEVDDKSELLVGMLWGALTQIRFSGSKSAAKPMALQILKILDSWQSNPK